MPYFTRQLWTGLTLVIEKFYSQKVFRRIVPKNFAPTMTGRSNYGQMQKAVEAEIEGLE